MKNPPFPDHPILIVDDEIQALTSFRMELRLAGLSNVQICQDSRQVLPFLAAQRVETVILDLSMPHLGGQELLAKIKDDHPEVPVIVVTGLPDLRTAVDCMKAGAADYLVKPVEEGELAATLSRVMEVAELRRERDSLKNYFLASNYQRPAAFSAILTNNNEMLKVLAYAEAIAPSTQPVLITGETGTGKGLLARAIHELSGRKGDLVRVDVAALDDSVFADTLFGHVRGAFTGADRDRAGLVDRARGGTLFLDEIGDLSATSQLKLLSLLQEKEYLPLGSDQPRPCQARVIVATNRNLKTILGQGSFRRDLYFRFQAHHVHLPALRDRDKDLPLLVDHFIDEAARELNKRTPILPKELCQVLAGHAFPGNIRELRMMIFDAVASHRSGVLSTGAFKRYLGQDDSSTNLRRATGGEILGLLASLPILPTLKEARGLLIKAALAKAGGNLTQAAAFLGISRPALSKCLKLGRRTEGNF